MLYLSGTIHSQTSPSPRATATSLSDSITRVLLTNYLKLPEHVGRECLVVLHGPNIGQRFELSRGSTLLGREPNCDLVVESDSVSRSHARLTVSSVGSQIVDLNSTNGTYINDRPITEQLLHSGDLIRLGDVIFKFLAGRHVEAAYHEEIYRLTIHDGLTALANVRYLNEVLEREMSRARRYGRELSIILLDIDFFKNVNDSFGHLVGDSILRELALRLSVKVRPEELLARYGGEEFCLVLPETSLAGALAYGEHLRTAVEQQRFVVDDVEIPLTISLGVAAFSPDMNRPNDFIQAADRVLYRAKRHGRNRVES